MEENQLLQGDVKNSNRIKRTKSLKYRVFLFFILFVFLVLFIWFLLLAMTGGYHAPRDIPNNSYSYPSTAPKVNQKIEIGEQRIEVRYQDSYVLPDGETKIVASSSAAGSLPEIDFYKGSATQGYRDSKYIFMGLSLPDKISFSNNGVFIMVKKITCKDEYQWFGDYGMNQFAGCTIQVSSKNEEQFPSRASDFSLNWKASGDQYHGIISEAKSGLFVYGDISYSILSHIFSKKDNIDNIIIPLSSTADSANDNTLRMKLITDYGQTTFIYTPKELWHKVDKENTIGTVKVRVTIKDLNCMVKRISGGLTREDCNPLFNFSFSAQDKEDIFPVRLETYN